MTVVLDLFAAMERKLRSAKDLQDVNNDVGYFNFVPIWAPAKPGNRLGITRLSVRTGTGQWCSSCCGPVYPTLLTLNICRENGEDMNSVADGGPRYQL